MNVEPEFIPAALLAESLLMSTNCDLRSLRVELTDLMAPMVVLAATKI